VNRIHKKLQIQKGFIEWKLHQSSSGGLITKIKHHSQESKHPIARIHGKSICSDQLMTSESQE
jgi:hypothetical protein